MGVKERTDLNFHDAEFINEILKSHFPPVCFTGGILNVNLQVGNEGPRKPTEPIRAKHAPGLLTRGVGFRLTTQKSKLSYNKAIIGSSSKT